MPKKKLKNNYLHQRSDSKLWQFRRRVPGDLEGVLGKSSVRRSLKTADVSEARRMRDILVREQDREWASIRRQQLILQNDNDKLPLNDAAIIEAGRAERLEPDYRPLFDEITDELDEMVRIELEANPQITEYEAFAFVTEETFRGAALFRRLQLWQGELSWVQLGEDHLRLNPMQSGTEREYRRAYERADHALPTPMALDRNPQAKLLVQAWVNNLGTEQKFARATIKKAVTALRVALRSHGYEPNYLSNLSFPKVQPVIRREPWTDDDIGTLMAACEYDWLRRAIIIAAHTGARQGAIAGMEYLPDRDWIRFPRMKKESSDRLIPCPDVIREVVRAWVAEPRTKSSVSNRFTELKKSVGFEADNTRVFHSFRQTALSRLTNVHGVDVHHAKLIAGHEVSDDILRAYYSSFSPDDLRVYANRLVYPTLEEWYD